MRAQLGELAGLHLAQLRDLLTQCPVRLAQRRDFGLVLCTQLAQRFHGHRLETLRPDEAIAVAIATDPLGNHLLDILRDESDLRAAHAIRRRGVVAIPELDAAQRQAVLNTLLPEAAGRIGGLSALKAFPLGLTAERTLVDGRSVRIGNAAQTLHPVAGQGLNLGLRDAYELVQVLRHSAGVDAALQRVEWARAADRWSMIAATDFLARSFTWQLPGLAAARGLGLAALQAAAPLKSLLARRMMFGAR